MSWQTVGIIFSIGLWLFAPYYRRLTDSVIWPRISDWLAARSRKALIRQARLLDVEIKASENVVPFSDFERLSLRTQGSTLVLVWTIGHFGLGLSAVVFLYNHFYLGAGLAVVFDCLLTTIYVRYRNRLYRQLNIRSVAYQAKLNERMNHLLAKAQAQAVKNYNRSRSSAGTGKA